MKNTVILISEENHGTIGIATSMLAAKQWLLRENWVYAGCEVWIPQTQEVVTLESLYGENWKEIYLSFNADEMEELGFYLHRMEVQEEENV